MQNCITTIKNRASLKAQILSGLALLVGLMANASAAPTTVVEAIEDAGTSLAGQAIPVAVAGLAVAVILFGGRLLWRFFKGIAK